jgi:FOG: Ankyrin repeat
MYRDVSDVLAQVQEAVPFLGIELKDVDQRSIFGDTPLILVMTWGDVAAASLLIEAGADVSVKGEDGDTALHRAASFGHAELIALLLANNARASAENDDGYTPLQLAELGGNEAIVQMLDI